MYPVKQTNVSMKAAVAHAFHSVITCQNYKTDDLQMLVYIFADGSTGFCMHTQNRSDVI